MPAFVNKIYVIILAGIFLTALKCTQQTTGTGGTGSETVIGKIIKQDGTPADQTVVTLYPSDYNPADTTSSPGIYSDTTGSDGYYRISLISAAIKKYTLNAVNLRLRSRSIVPDIQISPTGDSTPVAVATLYKTGDIKLILPGNSIDIKGYAYIPGTTYHASISNGYATIDSVPAGTIPQICYIDRNTSNIPQVVAHNVKVITDVTSIVAESGIAYSKKIFLNTASGGAAVSEDIFAFPLLIRLSGNNFDFTQFKTAGSDLRFTKSDNTILPFEIERWDTTAQNAEIWVKVDTVHGNNSSQFIVMSWGATSTYLTSNNPRVFDTTNGFRGVWHLGEEASGVGTKQLYKDATGRCSGDDYISATDRSGIIGYGHAFDGIDDFIPLNHGVTNLSQSDLTIALWISIQDSAGTILSKLDTLDKWSDGCSSFYFGDGTNTQHNTSLNGTRPSFVAYANDYAISGQSIVNNTWSYLVYTWKWNGDNTGTSRYFINGKEVNLSRDSLMLRVGENSSATIRVGQPNNNESYNYFKGSMDELEISSVVRSAAWIKLSYINQGVDTLFVVQNQK
jgi:Concanavalin A-like lectin/glucanases superfamily/Domain of unknown function (DUF2341)